MSPEVPEVGNPEKVVKLLLQSGCDEMACGRLEDADDRLYFFFFDGIARRVKAADLPADFTGWKREELRQG